MNQPRLYNELSYLWPIISPPGEYGEEAEFWRSILRDKLGPAKPKILELGSGGGHNLSHLTKDFQATAVDISPQMLSLSRQLNPDVQHLLGDMRSVRLGQTFDAVLIHDAINHMLTEADLRATFATAIDHLGPGGLLVIAPDWVKEEFQGPKLFHWIRDGIRDVFRDGFRDGFRDEFRDGFRDGFRCGYRGKKKIAVTIQEYLYDPDPEDSQIESIFSYMIQMEGSVRIERDVHANGLFPVATWTGLLGEAGFIVERVRLPVNKGGYGGNMFLGSLPTV